MCTAVPRGVGSEPRNGSTCVCHDDRPWKCIGGGHRDREQHGPACAPRVTSSRESKILYFSTLVVHRYGKKKTTREDGLLAGNNGSTSRTRCVCFVHDDDDDDDTASSGCESRIPMIRRDTNLVSCWFLGSLHACMHVRIVYICFPHAASGAPRVHVFVVRSTPLDVCASRPFFFCFLDIRSHVDTWVSPDLSQPSRRASSWTDFLKPGLITYV